MLRIILQKNGLAPNKDVTVIIVGAQEESVIALRNGRIVAALITPPRNFMFQHDGFNRIAYSGDYMSTYANGGIGLTDEKIKANSAEAMAFRARHPQSAPVFAEKSRRDDKKLMPSYLGIKDASLIDPLYDLYLTRQSADGSVDENWMKGAIEFTQRTLGGPGKEVLPSQVFDFSFVQKGLR